MEFNSICDYCREHVFAHIPSRFTPAHTQTLTSRWNLNFHTCTALHSWRGGGGFIWPVYVCSCVGLAFWSDIE